MTESSLAGLPFELLLHIMSQLDDFGDALSCGMICRRLNKFWQEHSSEVYLALAPRILCSYAKAARLLDLQFGEKKVEDVDSKTKARRMRANAETVASVCKRFEARTHPMKMGCLETDDYGMIIRYIRPEQRRTIRWGVIPYMSDAEDRRLADKVYDIWIIAFDLEYWKSALRSDHRPATVIEAAKILQPVARFISREASLFPLLEAGLPSGLSWSDFAKEFDIYVNKLYFRLLGL